ncbi:ribonuclease HII [Nitrolancea hollandica]|uniref:Ribonuclease HII n=1 Tax=Nitrolancea hollandica Lb TaxID=1129897 RepID=I4EGJ7_9BACT|nr:ribonuclease HII [Nitrolancea hollandica]CCF83809.1 Ribonuclease HII [Nitrolancea hollandica Lb]
MRRSQAPNPSPAIEQRLWERGLRLVAGVDEAGRGCLAGPVVAAACILPAGLTEIPGVRDSKLLTPAQRRELYLTIHETAIAIGVGAASRREIDRYNIRVASVLAMQRALARAGIWDHALCDGPMPPELDPRRHSGIVDGDAICLSIAAASIVAKVTRDALMARLAARHPEFGWERNAGYGTAAHLDALQRFGPTPHHRRTFAPVRAVLHLTPGVGIP